MNFSKITPFAGIFITTILTGLLMTEPQSASAQKACVINENGNTVCGKLTPPAKKPSQPPVYRKNIKNYTISLKGCRRQELAVKCSLTVANTGAEKRFSISPVNSSLVDAKGRAYKGTQISMGGKTDVYSLVTISPGIEYAAELTFENIPEQLTEMPIVNIQTNSGKVQFRNIALSI